jgi:chromatin remodeling complex protein RSC6
MSETESKVKVESNVDSVVVVVEHVDENASNVIIEELISSLENEIKEKRSQIVKMKNIKKENSKIDKKVKLLEKIKGGRRKKGTKEKAVIDPNAEPKGFNKPVKISAVLSAFLGLDEGTEISRPEVTHKLSDYIKKYELQSADDGRNIDLSKPGGDKLAEILNVARDMKIDYFKMQTHLTHHYPVSKKKLRALEKAALGDAVPPVVDPVTTSVPVVAAVEGVDPVEDVKPRRRRRVEETTPVVATS